MLRSLLALLLSVTDMPAAQPVPAPPAVTCAIRVPAEVERAKPVMLTVVLRNRGTTPLAVLNWGTPFEEAWLQPFVRVERDGRLLDYGGAMVKRGDPERDEYLRLAPGHQQSAQIDLAEVFDLSVPGRYVITPQMTLYDVVPLPTSLPRPRAVHASLPLPCPPATLRIVSRGQSR
jgi:hypothetical protein